MISKRPPLCHTLRSELDNDSVHMFILEIALIGQRRSKQFQIAARDWVTPTSNETSGVVFIGCQF